MGKDPWQVPDHDNDSIKPSEAWKRAAAKPKVALPVKQPKFVRLVIFLVGAAFLLGGLSLAIPLSGDVDPYLVRGVLVMVIFGGAAAYWSRSSWMRLAKVAGLWIVIIVGISSFYIFKSDFSGRFMAAIDPSGVSSTSEGLLVHRGRDGHFWLRASINGSTILMMVDTGASNVVLSPDDARKIGFNISKLRFDRRAQTANGNVSYAVVRADSLAIGDTEFTDVMVTVNGSDMSGSLLGMAVLDRFSSIEFRGDTLILRP